MEAIRMIPEGEEQPVDFYVLEETTIGGKDYFLVTDKEEGDGEAYILKDLSAKEDAEAIFEMVTDDKELQAVASIFQSLLEDVTLEQDE